MPSNRIFARATRILKGRSGSKPVDPYQKPAHSPTRGMATQTAPPLDGPLPTPGAPGSNGGKPGALGSNPTFASIGVKNTKINTAPGVELTDQQRVLVGSVLDVRRHVIAAGFTSYPS